MERRAVVGDQIILGTLNTLWISIIYFTRIPMKKYEKKMVVEIYTVGYKKKIYTYKLNGIFVQNILQCFAFRIMITMLVTQGSTNP